jgi:SP family myo-inositol transporter-like MFS transporter 13
MDSPETPLITTDEPSMLGNKLEGRITLRPFVITITLASGLSSLLSGYEIGVTSAALVSIGSSLSDRILTSFDKSMITSATALFALIAAPLASVLADKVGRRRLMLYADILFIVASITLASCTVVGLAIIGRCIIGVAGAFSSIAVPLYISEISPASHRGMLITATILLVTVGQILGFLIANIFTAGAPERQGWRWTFGLGVVPSAAQAIIISFMPDTPRWLIMVGRLTAAKRVLQRIYGNDDDAERLTDQLINNIQSDARDLRAARRQRTFSRSGRFQWLNPWRELLSQHRYRRALATAILLLALQQLCGFNSLMYFSATIFKMVGFENPTLASLAIASTNFIFTTVSLAVIDTVGRRRMLLRSMPFMILGLFLAATGFSYLPISMSPPDGRHTSDSSGAARLVLASIILFVASFALGLGNIPAMQSELYPLAVRSLGSGLATTVGWTGNFIVSLTFLPLMGALSPAWTLILYAIICMIGYSLIWLIYPETAGLSIEDAAELLEHGWIVRH